MTVKAQLVFGLDKIRLVVTRVRAVATGAGTFGDGPVHVDLVELFFLFLVARVTKRFDRLIEQRRIFRAMRIMARRALFGAKRVVNRFAFEVVGFVVTSEADVAAIRSREKPGVLRCVRVVTRGALLFCRKMTRLRLERFANIAVTGGAEFALLHLKNGLGIRRVRAVAQGALAGLERHMRDLVLHEIALIGMTHQAKSRHGLGDGERGFRVGGHVARAASHHHPGMYRITNNFGLRRAVRRVAVRASGVRHRVAAVRLRDIGRREIMALLA